MHKGLREVLGVPLVERNLRALLWFGFERVFVAVSAQERALLEWVKAPGGALAEEGGARLEPIVEACPLGTIGAAACLPGDVQNALVVNVDNLTALDLRALADFHRETGATATLATHPQAVTVPCGVLHVEGRRVVGYREKPQIDVSAASGACVLARRAIDWIRAGTRVDVPTLVASLLAAGEPVAAFVHADPWIDVNDEATLVRADRMMAEHAPRWPWAQERALP